MVIIVILWFSGCNAFSETNRCDYVSIARNNLCFDNITTASTSMDVDGYCKARCDVINHSFLSPKVCQKLEINYVMNSPFTTVPTLISSRLTTCFLVNGAGKSSRGSRPGLARAAKISLNSRHARIKLGSHFIGIYKEVI